MTGRGAMKGKPRLVHERDEQFDIVEKLALERVGRPEQDHDLNRPMRVRMSHAVIACSQCGGVYGGDGVKEGVGRCPTKRCACKRRGGGVA